MSDEKRFLVILQCTSRKQEYDCPASEMYMKSARFRKFYPLAKKIPNCDVMIYSALYGLIPEDRVISPYNASLELGVPSFGGKTITKEEKIAFKNRALEAEKRLIPILKDQLANIDFNSYAKVFCVFSKRYKEVLLKTGIDTNNFMWLQENCGGYFKIPKVVSGRLEKIAEKLETIV